MLVKRIPDDLSKRDNFEMRTPQISGKTSRRECFLKAVIGSQERKIRELMLNLDATTKAYSNLLMKVSIFILFIH